MRDGRWNTKQWRLERNKERNRGENENVLVLNRQGWPTHGRNTVIHKRGLLISPPKPGTRQREKKTTRRSAGCSRYVSYYSYSSHFSTSSFSSEYSDLSKRSGFTPMFYVVYWGVFFLPVGSMGRRSPNCLPRSIRQGSHKLNFTLEKAMKPQWGSRATAVLFLWPRR